MIEDNYYNRCRIRRVRIIAAEPLATYECDSLPQPFEVFTPSYNQDFLKRFDQFEWLVQFYTFGQPTRTDLREKTVEYGKDLCRAHVGATILTRGVGQIVAITRDAVNPNENTLIVDIGTRGPLYVLTLNRDFTLKIGDWVELKPQHAYGLPNRPLMSVIAQATHVIKIPKD